MSMAVDSSLSGSVASMKRRIELPGITKSGASQLTRAYFLDEFSIFFSPANSSNYESDKRFQN